jgi:hypothetical protein
MPATTGTPPLALVNRRLGQADGSRSRNVIAASGYRDGSPTWTTARSLAAIGAVHQPGPSQAPAYWDDSRFNQPGQPVVGVSVYEAEAYCRCCPRSASGPCGCPPSASGRRWPVQAAGFSRTAMTSTRGWPTRSSCTFAARPRSVSSLVGRPNRAVMTCPATCSNGRRVRRSPTRTRRRRSARTSQARSGSAAVGRGATINRALARPAGGGGSASSAMTTWGSASPATADRDALALKIEQSGRAF